ncbi:hypothetical protein [Desulfobacter latus]|uniref:DUF86 domain-containing protein n=1 Tax=Desulfobacter latus TaxID=2292 RepID=A0A850ST96_9BACT|nr:hypothetical protein [Desulfobacter latus]NWH04369.1 hypothetical protein [Desulfobacter latus]
MNNLVKHLESELLQLEKATEILRYSYEKCKNINLIEGVGHQELESFEALTGRFARMSDMLIQRIFRLIDNLDLEDSGTVRDRINRAEKKGLISSADIFIEIRILRNEIAHEYKSETIYALFEKVVHLTPHLFKAVESTREYASKYFI